MKIRAMIWDLDGTLLNTLDDLANSTNAALKMNGFPERSVDEVRRFVGNGIRRLIERAVPEGTAISAIDQVHRDFVAHYSMHSMEKTAPYPGVPKMMRRLSEKGMVHAVVSNKIDSAVKKLTEFYFGNLVDISVGDDPSRRKKPAPDSVLEVMRRMNAMPSECIYIGDSDVDIETARNAGLPCISVTWGFRDEAFLLEHGASHLLSSPDQMEVLLEAL